MDQFSTRPPDDQKNPTQSVMNQNHKESLDHQQNPLSSPLASANSSRRLRAASLFNQSPVVPSPVNSQFHQPNSNPNRSPALSRHVSFLSDSGSSAISSPMSNSNHSQHSHSNSHSSFTVNLSVIVPQSPHSSSPSFSSPSPKPLVATPTFRMLTKHEFPSYVIPPPLERTISNQTQLSSPSPKSHSLTLTTASPDNSTRPNVTSRGRTVKPPPDREMPTIKKRSNAVESKEPQVRSVADPPVLLNSADSVELDDLHVYHEQIWTLWQLRADYLIGENRRKLKKSRPNAGNGAGTPRPRGPNQSPTFPSPEHSSLSLPSSPMPSPHCFSSPAPSTSASRIRISSPLPLSSSIDSSPIADSNHSALCFTPIPSPLLSSASSRLHPSSSPTFSSHSIYSAPHIPNARISGYKEFYIPHHPSQLTFQLIDELSILLTMPVPPAEEDLPAFKLLSSMLLLPLPPPIADLPPIIKPRFNYDWMESNKKQWKQPNQLIQCVSDKDSEHANSLNNNHFLNSHPTENTETPESNHNHNNHESAAKRAKLTKQKSQSTMESPKQSPKSSINSSNVKPQQFSSNNLCLLVRFRRSTDTQIVDVVNIAPATADNGNSQLKLKREVESLEAAIRREKADLKALKRKSKRIAEQSSTSPVKSVAGAASMDLLEQKSPKKMKFSPTKTEELNNNNNNNNLSTKLNKITSIRLTSISGSISIPVAVSASSTADNDSSSSNYLTNTPIWHTSKFHSNNDSPVSTASDLSPNHMI